ncbi:DUF4358 domain-containing protein [Phocea massiliensis]|uniref:DUF4358 domain-containing protein n=1 Tax=Merdimmobilis hominis TaxID=2897707 RepID=A0A939BE57_9FIRM|nr:DUF4358 domain-containing protein [Merdimmobilis hominis]MBM6920965.1 DUF4358 domain-containing protein [Merdimmobilis hominis]
MRKFLAGMMCLVLLLASAACSSNTEVKNPNLSDVIGEIRAAVEFPEMAEIKVADLPMYGYDLAPEDVAEMQFITAGSGFTADEVVLIKLTDESKAEEVKKMAQTRRDGIAETAQNYTPDEMEKLTTAVVGVKGPYVYYAATNDNAKAKEILTNAF